MEKVDAVWRAFQDKVLEPLAAMVFLTCTLLALLEVVRRYVFGFSFEWQQDAVTYFILASVYLYLPIVQRQNAHLNVTVLLDVVAAFGARGRIVAEGLRIVAAIISLALVAAWIWWAIPVVSESIHYETRTDSLAFPLWPFQLALLLGFGLTGVTMIFQLWNIIRKLVARPVPVDVNSSDPEHS